MTIEELEALAASKVPAGQIQGPMGRDARRGYKLGAGSNGVKTEKRRAEVRDLLKMSLGAESPAPGLEIEEFKAEGRLGELLDRPRRQDRL